MYCTSVRAMMPPIQFPENYSSRELSELDRDFFLRGARFTSDL